MQKDPRLEKMIEDEMGINSKNNENEDDESFYNENKKSYYVFMVAATGLLGGYCMMQINQMGNQNKSSPKVK
jgi:hypothetical protein